MVDDIKKYSIPRTRAELMHSRPMDVHQACYHKGMWVLRDKIYTNNLRPLMEYESNAVKRQLQKLLVDLYQAWFHDPTLLIAVSFNNNDYVLDKRYNKIHITQKIITIIKQLIGMGIFTITKVCQREVLFVLALLIYLGSGLVNL